LTYHDRERGEATIYAFYAALPVNDFDSTHLWRGTAREVPQLLSDLGGTYGRSPTNLWPADHSWFVCTDWDLSGTKVSGSEALIERIKLHPILDTIDWTPPA